MRRLDVQIPAPDGHSNGTLHVPDVHGRWPGVLVFPDAGGARETFRQMGDRLASMDYVALIPGHLLPRGPVGTFRHGHRVHRQAGAGTAVQSHERAHQ
jgi:dienelactone hydrolase